MWANLEVELEPKMEPTLSCKACGLSYRSKWSPTCFAKHVGQPGGGGSGWGSQRRVSRQSTEPVRAQRVQACNWQECGKGRHIQACADTGTHQTRPHPNPC
eukprot:scaffold134175_cov18-Tisochrysis_lutea.AAC.1